MSLIIQTLRKAQRAGHIVAIYADPSSPQSCSSGYVRRIGKKAVTLASLSRGGGDDGFVVRRLSHIFKVEIGGVYAQKLALLSSHDVRPTDRGSASSQPEGFVEFEEALESAKAKGVAVSIWLEMDSDDTYTCGFVERIGSNEVLIRKLDDYGRADGLAVFSITNIDAMDVDGVSERRLALLNKAASYDYTWPD